MSLSIANQMYKTLISVKECQGCNQYSYEYVENVAIPFCRSRWFGGRCVKEADTKKGTGTSFQDNCDKNCSVCEFYTLCNSRM